MQGPLNYDPMRVAKPGPYVTQLAPADEAKFLAWVKQNKVPFDPNEDKADYDMRGYWKALQEKNPVAVQALNPNDNKMHFPDVWKTPYHRTFSAESMYALPNAGHWVGSKLIDPTSGQVIFDETRQLKK